MEEAWPVWRRCGFVGRSMLLGVGFAVLEAHARPSVYLSAAWRGRGLVGGGVVLEWAWSLLEEAWSCRRRCVTGGRFEDSRDSQHSQCAFLRPNCGLRCMCSSALLPCLY